MTAITHRLHSLRQAMSAAGIDAVLVPSSDPHLSEYLPGYWQGRRWLSGFHGSVGTLVVTADFAGLWADSRYWVQAEQELAGSGIALMKIQTVAQALHLDWLAANLQAGQTVAVDGDVLGLAASKALQAALQNTGIKLRTDIDLLQSIWQDRPSLPQQAIYEHLPPFASTSRQDKLAAVRKAMQQQGASHHFISTLDDIAWLLNLRGADVNYNPVFVSHLLLAADQAWLFVGEGKIPAELQQILAADGVQLVNYENSKPTLAALPAQSVVLLDPRRVTFGLRQAIAATVVEAINPSTLLKACKTEAEAEHVRAAMVQDGVALAEFFCWFEANIGKTRITELTIDDEITAARARRPNFVSASFATIAGFNANGALPHYRATEESHAVIEGNGLLLIDSGGQYLGGTTDITRVVAVGTPTAEQKRDFTLVLKGMINLSRTRFPQGTLSPMLDALARAPIWEHAIDFGHGVGHGVGYFMNVHEGPQSISRSVPDATMAMLPGMITSNEPGIYRPGQWGVRIENLVLNVPHASNAFGDFMAFETLTLCPIDLRCIERSLMSEADISWLNAYHQLVHDKLAPHLQGEPLAWLQNATQSL